VIIEFVMWERLFWAECEPALIVTYNTANIHKIITYNAVNIHKIVTIQ